jgi:hypothetical protein
MIAPQTPPLPVLIPVQAVAGTDVPSQRLAPVAAIETDHIVPVQARTAVTPTRERSVRWLNARLFNSVEGKDLAQLDPVDAPGTGVSPPRGRR